MDQGWEPKPGQRVKIVLSKIDLKCGDDKFYPDGGTGTVTDLIVESGENYGCYCDSNQGKIVYVTLDKPFRPPSRWWGKQQPLKHMVSVPVLSLQVIS